MIQVFLLAGNLKIDFRFLKPAKSLLEFGAQPGAVPIHGRYEGIRCRGSFRVRSRKTPRLVKYLGAIETECQNYFARRLR